MAEGVQIYGAIDYGVLVRGGTDGLQGQAGTGSTVKQFEDGISGENFIGFKGSEDLGNGMKVIFDSSFRFSGDTSSTFYAKTAFVGLTGDFGTVIGGRVGGARYSFTNKYDPFGGYTVGTASGTIGGQADVADNAIAWITPEILPGLKGLAAYTSALDNEDLLGLESCSLGAAASNFCAAPGLQNRRQSPDRPLYALALMYDQGPLSVTLDYENANKYGDQQLDIYVAGASYDLGVVKVSGYWEKLRGQGLGDPKSWFLGATAPVSEQARVLFSYVDTELGNGGNALGGDCQKASIGARYDLSKRTTLYADYARINNDSNTACSIVKNGHRDNPATAGTQFGGAVAGGQLDGGNLGLGHWGFDAGIRHTF